MNRLAELRDEIAASGSGHKLSPEPHREGDTPREHVRQHLNDRQRLEEMEKHGLLKMGTGTLPDSFWDLPAPEDPDGEVMRALLDERESSR